jgi:hypothetical protein
MLIASHWQKKTRATLFTNRWGCNNIAQGKKRPEPPSLQIDGVATTSLRASEKTSYDGKM